LPQNASVIGQRFVVMTRALGDVGQTEQRIAFFGMRAKPLLIEQSGAIALSCGQGRIGHLQDIGRWTLICEGGGV
jgi:hypothetical protein